MVETGLIVALIAIVCISSVTDVGHSLAKKFCELRGRGYDANANTTYIIDQSGKGSCSGDPFDPNPNNSSYW